MKSAMPFYELLQLSGKISDMSILSLVLQVAIVLIQEGR